VSKAVDRRDEGWYSVRCFFRLRWADSFEERITLWWATSFDAAIASAEDEAREFAETCELEYLSLAQAYYIGPDELTDGVEMFSLIRDSELPAKEYLSRFFDTGREHQGATRG
jgi:hypothetical protein